MFVPTLPQEKLIETEGDGAGYLTKPWANFFEQLQQNMQQALSNEGILSPSQTSSDIAIIQPNALGGTLIFNTSAVNGGSPTSPNGQLYIRLLDGTFHPITNT